MRRRFRWSRSAWLVCFTILFAFTGCSRQAGPSVEIRNARWYLNGKITYPGAPAEGLLQNVRMVNSTFEDANDPAFDSAANTRHFLDHLPEYVGSGVRAFTLNLQGGFPGYEGAVNSAFRPDGSLRPEYLARMEQVIRAIGKEGAVVILGCYYQRQDQILQDSTAVEQGIRNVVRWLRNRRLGNVVLEIANEYPHRGFDHAILHQPEGVARLINLAHRTNPNLLVSASGLGNGRTDPTVAVAADFILIHFNGTSVEQIPSRIEAAKSSGKPVVCNEDDKTGTEAVQALQAAVRADGSWGYMNNDLNQYQPFTWNGTADDPAVYQHITELASPSR